MTKRLLLVAAAGVGLAALAGPLRARGAARAARTEANIATEAAAMTRREAGLEREIACTRLVRGNPQRREVALTFDDGPHPIYTLKLLDILRRERVPATFFVVGAQVDRYPTLVQAEAADGFEVANHTYHHLRLPTLAPAAISEELKAGADAIARATGEAPRLFRPPGGEYDADVVAAAKRLGLVMVLWTDDPGDYACPGPGVIVQRTFHEMSNGGILLMHDGVQQTLDVLPGLIERLKREGYRFVTCSEMAREHGVVTTGGPRVAARRRGVV